ncbi:hypothetical protein ACFQJ8_07400 [Halocatena marina]|uniref:hypothetical protein n=1 Tax=Halocatena marina TaxID=2934937 RepID=UPI003607CD41
MVWGHSGDRTGNFRSAEDRIAVFESWILSGTIVALVFLAGWVWYFVDNFWMRTIAFYGTWKTRLTGHSERTVRGFLEHGDVHWTASYTAERTVVDIDQLCPFCHMKLIPRTMPRREVRRPNTAVTADERTHETTISVRENVFGREKNAATDLINSLSCPRESCSFAIQGEQHVSTERTAVENQFLTHIDRMRGGGIDPYKRWREDAESACQSTSNQHRRISGTPTHERATTIPSRRLDGLVLDCPVRPAR